MSLHLDETRGHFVLDLPEVARELGYKHDLIGADLGAVLHVDITSHLGPEDARELARALNWWADRKHPTEAREVIDVLAEPDLLDMLGGAS